jgi:carbon storage regulator
MLVLSRKPLQQIMVGSDIVITIVKIDRNHVRLGIQAPPDLPILRNELVKSRSLNANRPPLHVKKPMGQ